MLLFDSLGDIFQKQWPYLKSAPSNSSYQKVWWLRENPYICDQKCFFYVGWNFKKSALSNLSHISF